MSFKEIPVPTGISMRDPFRDPFLTYEDQRGENQPVGFTRKQMQFLERMYPEKVGTVNTTPEERLWNAAQRSVLEEIRARVQG